MITVRPVHFLSFFVVILFAVPAYFIVPGTGAAGSPSVLLGLVCLGWWCLARFVLVDDGPNGRNPVRVALFAYMWFVVLTWTIGKRRVLSGLESTQSDRVLIVMFALMGVALLAMDGLRTRQEINRLAQVIAWAAAFMVFVGIVQFAFGFDIARSIRIPGLVANVEDAGLNARSVFIRPSGTALHAIEFGVVSAALVPIAYWARRSRPTWPWLLPLGGLCFASMISLSRSAVLALAVVAIVVIADASWRDRANFVVLGALFIVAAGFVVDGLVGTLGSLFTQAEHDPSVQARIDRFPRVMELVAEHPWLGRGFGTYNNQDYFLLDNELHKTVIETGLIGVMILVLFVLFVVGVAWRTRGRLPREERVAGVALAATILGLFISSYTFDAFFYRILTTMLYLCIGMVGALWRVSASPTEHEETPPGSAVVMAASSGGLELQDDRAVNRERSVA